LRRTKFLPQVVVLAKELSILEEALLIEETLALRADQALLVPVHVHQIEHVLVVHARVAPRAYKLLLRLVALLRFDLARAATATAVRRLMLNHTLIHSVAVSVVIIIDDLCYAVSLQFFFFEKQKYLEMNINKN
jgi:hypothetical protein